MKRRKFITLLGGAAAWPIAAHAQQGERMRRIGVLMAFGENDPKTKDWLSNFTQRLAELGWTDRRTARMDVRWAAGSVDRMRTFAKELVELQPDVIFAGATPATAAVKRETRTIPIVFAVVSDPVGAGFVAGLPRPGGNITGFTNVEAALGGKWLEMLKEITPRVRRVAFMFNPDTAPGGGAYFLGTFEAAARSLAVEPITARVRSDAEIEAAIASLGRDHAGLVIMPDSFMQVHQEQSFRRQPAAMCRPWGPTCLVLPRRAACFRTERASRIFFAVQLPMSIAFCGARTRVSFQCKRRPSTSW
jgi:putative ABC transport system substrate-binding protein